MRLYVLWALLFVAVQAALTLAQYLLRGRKIGKGARAACIAAKAVCASAFAALVMAGPVFLRPVQPLLVAAYAALLPDAAADAVCSVYCAVRKRARRFSVTKALSLVFGVLFFVYGTVNMQIVRPNRHTYTSPKLTRAHTIVFVADLHIGSAQTTSVNEKMIEAIRSEKPDAVILGGDITDDYTTKDEMEHIYGLFGGIGAPVYFVYGNHELVQHPQYVHNDRSFSERELLQTMRDSGIVVLTDAYADLAPDLLLLGREDAAVSARQDIAALPNPAPEKYLLVADHQPTLAADNLAAGTDLQLSAHTHAGQLFPNGTLLSLFSRTVGDFVTGGESRMLISAGAAGWRVPFRTQSHCFYEVITLQPENS